MVFNFRVLPKFFIVSPFNSLSLLENWLTLACWAVNLFMLILLKSDWWPWIVLGETFNLMYNQCHHTSFSSDSLCSILELMENRRLLENVYSKSRFHTSWTPCTCVHSSCRIDRLTNSLVNWKKKKWNFKGFENLPNIYP